MSFARNFAMGQQIAQTAMDAFDNARLGAILSESEKKPETLERFSDEDAQSIHDAAAAGKEVVWDEGAGGYAIKPAAAQALPSAAPEDGGVLGVTATPVPTATVTPMALTDGNAEVPPAAASPAAPVAAAPQPTTFKPQTHTTYLNKTTAGTLTPEQAGADKADYIRGRVSELFNPNLGLKRLREMQGEDREDFKFGLFKTEAKRKQKEQALEDAADAAEREVFRTQTAMGAATANYARRFEEYSKAKEAREKAIQEGASPDSLPPLPAMPAMPEISVADSLKDGITLQLARAQAGGKLNQEKLAQYAQMYQKAADEGYARALTAANDGAPIERVAELFNKAGKVKFDTNDVVGDDWTTDKDGTKQRVISIYDPDTKKTSKINVGAELASLGQAGAGLDKLYKMAQINYYNSGTKLRQEQIGATQALGQQRLSQAAVNGGRIDGTIPSGRGGKANKDKLAQVADLYKEFKPGAGGETQHAEGMNLAARAVEMNPNATPQAIAYATQVAVREGDASPHISRKLDFSTGKPVAVFTDPRDGQKVTLHSVPGNYKPTPEDKTRFNAEVSQYLDEEDKKMPGMASLLLGAAAGSQGGHEALQRQFAGQIQQDWMTAWEKDFTAKNQRAPARADRERAIQVTAQKAAQAAAEHMRRYDGVLSLIKQYGAQRTSQP